MSRTGEKAKLRYDIREQRLPNSEEVAYVPVIQDRDEPVTLAQVINHAIDTGRIAGLKTSAVESLAAGICDQMYQEFLEGDSVKFGDYFTAKLYLAGAVDSKTARVAGNDKVKLNVRLAQGTAFRVSKDDYSWTSVNDANAPFVDDIMSSTNTTGEIAKNNPFAIIGRNFGTIRSAIQVEAKYTVDGVEETATCTVTGVGDNQVNCGFPQDLAQVAVGTELKIIVTKTVDGVEYSSNAKKCKLAADPS